MFTILTPLRTRLFAIGINMETINAKLENDLLN